ncbi:MAG: glycosyl hydrolase, partial [Microbacteriaceae bacterium]
GAMTLCATDELAWSSPRIEPTASLGADDLKALTSAQRDELTTALGADLAGTGELAADTYFGGKQLARLANLLQLARDLGADDLAATAQTRLAEELRIWTEPAGCDDRAERCFAYDPTQPGMVGFAASFGADEYNDHHFHYGYFLYAAAIAASDDDELRDDIAPVITLLAADLASGSASELFPARRTFDPYSGHSWASGFSPFGDGNNQESSSEAVAAWNGLALWAETAGDDDLDAEARWMLAAEAASARTYWTDFDRSDPAYADYEHGVVGIVWDGKRDYSTWFSPEPAAILGIQLIPMTGVSDYLAGDPDRIRANVAEVDEAPQFADLLLMYSALAGPEDAAVALEKARDLPDAAIDDGNARSLLLAWLMVKAE